MLLLTILHGQLPIIKVLIGIIEQILLALLDTVEVDSLVLHLIFQVDVVLTLVRIVKLAAGGGRVGARRLGLVLWNLKIVVANLLHNIIGIS